MLPSRFRIPPLALLLVPLLTAAPARAQVRVSPAAVRLEAPEASQQLLVSQAAAGRSVDLTRGVQYRSLDPKVAVVGADGLVRPSGDGRTQVVVRRGRHELRVPVEVRGMRVRPPVSFENDIIPVLTKAQCNSGGCHGKAEGQNGFKLSVFGFDPQADYQALLLEGRGRRVSTARPEESLLLQKATAQLPHGGGKKIDPGSLAYRRLRRWLAEGAPYEAPGSQAPVRIVVEPEQQVLSPRGMQQLRVTAIDAAGDRRCVTTEAEYSSNAGLIADVGPRGLVQASAIPGEAAILVRYMGHVAVCRVTTPRPGARIARPAEVNFIDRLVWNKLERLGIAPSPLADDATFLRRVYLDTIGTLPTAAEARDFLKECAAESGKSGKPALQARGRLVDRLLQRPEYADYWTMRWSDLLRVDKDAVTPQGAVAMTRWLRKQIAENRPYDQFARDLLTARGDTTAEGPAAFYRALDKPEVASRSISQLFLGVRIECAQCHHHPSERWGQEDYFALAGFFTGVSRKKLPSGSEAVVSLGGTDLPHPRTKTPIAARALGATPAVFTGVTDRRQVLADWMTAPQNAYFARSIANRLWGHYFGRGLVEPLDDLRATNPATNEPLLDALATHMREVKYDLRAFTRTLLTSRVYQLSSVPNASNKADEQNFSHAAERTLPAEVLLDAICQVTGVPEKYNGWPEGYRAIQVWDNRMPSYFFRIFGRPVRASVCECERSSEPSIAQALHLMNSPEINDKIRSRSGMVRRLAESGRPPRELVDELYLLTLSRYPTEKERALLLPLFPPNGGAGVRDAVEDTLWSLINTKEFIFNH